MRLLGRSFALGLLTMLTAPSVQAIDHQDSASASAAPAADIADLFSWMSTDGSKVILALTVNPSATATSKFATDSLYVFHTSSRAAVSSTSAVLTDIVCGFDDSQRISCVVGDAATAISGDASVAAGITSSNGKARVFAGLRKDPSFVSIANFEAMKTAAKVSLAAVPTGDAAGCKATTILGTGKTSAQTALQGVTPSPNFFAASNVLALVMEVDRTLLNRGGPILAVWGATHKKVKTN